MINQQIDVALGNNLPESSCYERSIVAFLDILGFKNKVMQSEKDNGVIKILVDSLKICSGISTGGKKVTQGEGVERKIDFQSRFFSDSVVFFIKDSPADISHLFLVIRYLQDELWKKGLCVRGAITIGNMYWPLRENGEKDITLGNALIEAHELESTCAIYPRIVLSDKAYEYISESNCVAYPFGLLGKLKDYILKDEAGIYYMDLLHKNINRSSGEFLAEYEDDFSIRWEFEDASNLPIVIALVEKIVDDNIANSGQYIRYKYQWLEKYTKKSKNKI
ncbi:MAG: hypothetical protein WCI90_01355 [Chlorobium sp.]|nr:MAG: hypothetical protein FDX17_05560 [Chlorobium sp.]